MPRRRPSARVQASKVREGLALGTKRGLRVPRRRPSAGVGYALELATRRRALFREGLALGSKWSPKVPRCRPSARVGYALELAARRRALLIEGLPLGTKRVLKVPRRRPSAQRWGTQRRLVQPKERIRWRLHQLLVRLSVMSCDTYPLAAPSSRLRLFPGLAKSVQVGRS